jgi:hypothetical protein
MERSQGSDPTTNASSNLRREYYASVLETLRREPQEILIVGAEDPTHLSRPLKMVRIVMAQCVQITGRHDVDPRKPELTCDLRGHVLVQVKPKLTQKVMTRP